MDALLCIPFLYRIMAAQVDAALCICGIPAGPLRNALRQQGLDTMDNIRQVLRTDEDVERLARMFSRRPGNRRQELSLLQQINLQALAWWVRQRYCHQQPLGPNLFDANALDTAKARKLAEDQETVQKVEVSDLAPFKPDKFEEHEDAFKNLLMSRKGAAGLRLNYVARDRQPPADFGGDADLERLYQVRLDGPAFHLDNKVVYNLLKAYLVDTEAYTWIKGFDATQNGREAFLAWSDHYNGEGELSKRTRWAKNVLEKLHYKSEQSFSFERYSSTMRKCYQIIDKDPHLTISEHQKVETLLARMQTGNPGLIAAQTFCASNHSDNFIGACNYLSAEVARIFSAVHGLRPIQTPKKRGDPLGIYATTSNKQPRGGGRFGGRGGGRGSRVPTHVEGVDIRDVTKQFSAREWEIICNHGLASHITSKRAAINRNNNPHGGGRGGRGPGGRDGGRGRGGGGNGGRNVSAAGVSDGSSGGTEDGSAHDTGTATSDITGNSDRGSQHGAGFGGGYYRGRGRGRGGRGRQ